jgi:hypothetical protein
MDYYVEYHHYDQPVMVAHAEYHRNSKPLPPIATTYNSYGKVFTVYKDRIDNNYRPVMIQPEVVYAAPQPIVEAGEPPPYLPPVSVPVIQEPKKEVKMVDNTKDRFFHDCMKWYQSVRECTRIWNSDPDASVSD